MSRVALPVFLLVAALAPGLVTSASLGDALSPVSRVVELLQALSKKVQADSETEEDLYETYQCWAKTVIDSKTATNAAAVSRSESLSNYIADIDAGRVEFTSERVDLEKELETLNGELEAAKELRDQQNKDFLDAEDEMTKAIDALTNAGDVLKSATTDSPSLLRMRSQVNEGLGFAARAAEAASLNRAVQLGDKFLTKGDALFLRRLLTAEVPKPDWKKLNRKATFKNKYEHRSGKIQDVLAKLLQTFNSNLEDARSKEADALSQYDKLKEAKEEQKTAAEEALSKMDKENGAAGMSRSDAESEVEALTTQVTNDKKYISQVTESMTLKKQEWKDRKELRAGEIQAISKAISILHSDDSRDTFKKSMKSQGYSFLQNSEQAAVAARAVSTLREVARTTHDRRVAAIAAPLADVTAGSHFDKVIAAVDKMMQTLKDEEAEDLHTKETCEADRMADTREAASKSRAIDEMSDAITKLKSEIAELEQEIADKQATIKQITEEYNDAKRIRKDEKTEWLKSDADDEEAATVVSNAIGVLETFYKESGLMSLAQQPKVEAGKAPPPPPTTWEAPYGGKTGESTGIITILTMIKEDIVADRAKAKTAEDKAQSDFDTAESEFETQRDNLITDISDLEGEAAGKEGEVQDTKGSRRTEKGGLNEVVKRIKNAEPGCNFATVNFSIRSVNRQTEIDGLIKAKAILQGAAFSAPADEGREIKPGDAFLQRARPLL